ncbi:hypothetical protein FQZ97_924700 [compost metagenome]
MNSCSLFGHSSIDSSPSRPSLTIVSRRRNKSGAIHLTGYNCNAKHKYTKNFDLNHLRCSANVELPLRSKIMRKPNRVHRGVPHKVFMSVSLNGNKGLPSIAIASAQESQKVRSVGSADTLVKAHHNGSTSASFSRGNSAMSARRRHSSGKAPFK